MFFRPLVAALAVSFFALAVDPPKKPGSELPDPSLIQNLTRDKYIIQIAQDSWIDVPWGVVRFYDVKDVELKNPLGPDPDPAKNKYLKDGNSFELLPNSSVLMVLNGSETLPGKLYVNMKLGVDRNKIGATSFRVLINHWQYNKRIMLKENHDEMVQMMEMTGFKLPDKVKPFLEKMPEVAITVKKSNPMVTLNMDNYQKAEEGPFIVIGQPPAEKAAHGRRRKY